jgi:high-affinity nickel-transport protein
VTAATAAHLTSHFDQFSSVGNIIGTAVSASFLIVLGIMNTWILYKLIQGLIGWTKGEGGEKGEELWEKRGGGPMWWILKKLFRLIDRLVRRKRFLARMCA